MDILFKPIFSNIFGWLAEPVGARLKIMGRALTYRNYRLFFIGQGLSLIGTWMQAVALGWLVYRLTGSKALLGIVGFASQIPALFFSPIAGVFSDRYDRHRTIIITQILAMTQGAILAILAYAGLIAVWHIIVLSVFLGIVNAFDMPTRQAFISQMVKRKEDLGNAIALNSIMFNSARLIGPSIAGFIIAAFGEKTCFLINAISFLAAIAALLMMRDIKIVPFVSSEPIFASIREGFKYAMSAVYIRTSIFLLGCVSLFGMPYMVLMPVFAKEVLRGGPQTLGLLTGAFGIGALVGGVVLSLKKSAKGLEKTIYFSALVLGAGNLAFSFSGNLYLSMSFLVIMGFGMMTTMASGNTLIQTTVSEHMRGRVMSFYNVAFMGIAPFGSLLAGSVAQEAGAPNTLLFSGIVVILVAIILSQINSRKNEINTF